MTIPPTVSVPLRAPPVFGATEKFTVAVPAPDAGETVIQGWLTVTSHPHPAGVVTDTVPEPPVAANALALPVAVTAHGAALCRTMTRRPLTTRAPSRVVPFGFWATRNSTRPLPCP